MQTLNRDYCVFTGAKDLELLYSFKDFPVFMGCVEHEPQQDITTDMDWYISRSTGSLQLNPLLPLDVLYQDQHADSVGTIWTTHHEKFAEFVASFNCKSIFEIGGAHGILARNVQKLKPDTDWVLLEPNPMLVDDVEVKVIQCFFDDKFKYDGNFDAVVHSHVFEHIYFHSKFISQLSEFIPVGKYHLFSIPNMMAQLKSFFTNCLNFEHTVFLIENYVDYLLAKNGFRIIRKEYFREHSIFYATERIKDKSKSAPPGLYDQNAKLFNDFIQYHHDLINELNEKIDNSTLPVYLFGAHIFSQYLIAFQLHTDKIVCVLDNGPKKIGKRLYGTNMQVNSPKILKDLGSVNIILKAGAYNEEIKADILENINPSVTFWE